MISVELRPHIGFEDTPVGRVQVEHDQWYVMAKGEDAPQPVMVGYLGKASGRPFCPISSFVDLPREAQAEIHAAVNQLVGEERPMGIVPIPLAVAEAALDGVDEGDEEGDE